MDKETKNQAIAELTEELSNVPVFYLADTAGLTVANTNKLRRMCFNKKVRMKVIKNTLLKKALQKTNAVYEPMIDTLKGSTSIMFCASSSEPAKLIKEFRKENDKPVLKAAFVQESIYIGHNQLEFLASIKSKNEMIGEVIAILQSPAKNVISALLSGKNKLAGILKTLENKK